MKTATYTKTVATGLFQLGLSLSLLLVPVQGQALDHLSVKFTKKSQLRTSFRWIQNQPKLIRNSSLTPILVDSGYPGGGANGGKHDRPKTVGVPEEFNDVHLPYAAVGKIFFTKRNGEISTCTGAFAGAADTVITAAHCVLGMSGEWHSDFIFVLSYGGEQQDVYAVECVAVPQEWGTLEGDAALGYDYAFLRTTRASEQGSLGITNGIPPEDIMLVGYSNNIQNGRRMLRVAVDAYADGPDKLAYANNPLSTGSSGTPWLGMSTVYSVTSHFHKERKDIMLGPRFTRQTMDLLKYARNGCEGV
ncbi:MAG: hypothetical protein ABJ308_15580 [Halieaceae bacterium]